MNLQSISRRYSSEKDEYRTVSIIMGTYNQDKFISSAIESVINQTHKDWELIICDDGSTDHTQSILKRYAGKYHDRIKVLTNEKRFGVSRARNMALKEAKGEYIAFLDSDDWWEKDKLEKQLASFRNSAGLGMVFTMVDVIKDVNSSEADRRLLDRHLNKLSKPALAQKRGLIKEDNICLSSIMLSRKAISLAGDFDEGFLYQVEDWPLVLKTAYLFDLDFVPEKLVHYRLHKDSYSAKVFLRQRMKSKGFKEIYSVTKDFALKHLFTKGVSSITERLSFLSVLYYHLYLEDSLQGLRRSPLGVPLRKAKRLAGRLKRGIQDLSLIKAKKLLILFVTSKCDSKCKTCFYWRGLNNTKNEMRLEEIRSIFDSLPKTLCVLITGGEPFLRDDIEQVLDLAVVNDNILSVSINTNGTQPEKIVSILAAVLRKRKYPKPFHINVSLDGFKEAHNRIRGIDCYDKAVLTLKKLAELRKEFKNFFVAAVTVLSKDNIDQLAGFMDFVFRELPLSFHYFEIIRGVPRGEEALQLRKDDLERQYSGIVRAQGDYLKREGLTDKDIEKKMQRFLHLYRLQLGNFFEKKAWDVNCKAGRNSYTVYEDGRFSICELKDPKLKLKDFDFNIRKAMRSKIIKEEVAKADAEKCFCTHGCFILNSL
ncbi:glycosyltransferase [Candidatus Omnitrophota bacterium]